MKRERQKLQTFSVIHFRFWKFELDRPFRMLYPCHELINTKNHVSKCLISNIRVMAYLTFFVRSHIKLPTTTITSRCDNHKTSTQLTSNLALTLGSSHLRNVLVALSHPLDIDKNLFFHLLTWCNRLGKICTLTHFYGCQLASYVHLNQI